MATLLQQLPPPPPTDPVPWDFVGSLALALALGQVLAWFYVRHARVASDRRRLARLFAVIAATTMLVIFVVKSSIALSLGLVGALSIVRFRTPIKEPEELIYLFLAIALGIGLGAGATLVTVLSLGAVLAFLLVRGWLAADRPTRRLHMHVRADLDSSATGPGGRAALERLVELLEREHADADVRRVDTGERSLEVSVLFDETDARSLSALIERIGEILPGSSVSVVEALSVE